MLELNQLVTEHPGRERLNEYLMVALHRTGCQCEAVEVVRRTRGWLVSRLGLEPGLALRRIYQGILQRDNSQD